MSLINKDILNIVFQLVYKHHINIINRYYSDIVENRYNDSIKLLRGHNRSILLNWRYLNEHQYKDIYKDIYKSEYKIVCKLPTLY